MTSTSIFLDYKFVSAGFPVISGSNAEFSVPEINAVLEPLVSSRFRAVSIKAEYHFPGTLTPISNQTGKCRSCKGQKYLLREQGFRSFIWKNGM
jgi:hypothetical protein